MKVLDVACGIGRTADWFSNLYVGFDFVPEFIDIAKERHPKKEFLILDLKEKLPFKDSEFDLAILISVKGVVLGIVGEEKWGSIKDELRRVAKKVLSLEYTDPHHYEEIS